MIQIATAAPEIATALLHAASLCGREEFEGVSDEFDGAFVQRGAANARRFGLRRDVSVQAFRLSGDAKQAGDRLALLLNELREDTPETQVEGLARLAAAFAKVGDEVRAREVLGRVHEETLGYACAPKKDPQYAVWRDVLHRANAEDPAGRFGRVAFTMRQLAGMKETEGYASAHRIASAVLTEAALVDATTGMAAARAMAATGFLSWDGIVNGLLLGMVRRRPELAATAAMAWSSLALPFYAEPHFRSSKLGEFVTEALEAVDDSHLDTTIETLRAAIGSESVHRSRLGLFERLLEGARRRDAGGAGLSEELSRWRREAPPDQFKGTPGHFDDVETLSELEERCDAASDKTHWERPRAFARLVASSELDHSLRLYEKWPDLPGDLRARFALVDKAIAEGNEGLARRLVSEYPLHADEQDRWSPWLGGGKLAYFRSREARWGRRPR